MNVKKIIRQQIKLMKKLKVAINALNLLMRSSPKNDKMILKQFAKLLKKYGANTLILKSLCDFLQMIDDEKLVLNYELADIQLLLTELITFNKTDLESQLELYYFLYNIMDEAAAAKARLSDLKALIASRFEEVERYK